jgi:putative FmdB family regulatory protein
MMPIYEFYCRDCHTVFSFLSRGIGASRRPACPRCGKRDLPRRPSSFAISKGRKETEGGAEEGLPDIDESKLERAMAGMAGELESLDESDPKQAARLARRLYEAAGIPVAGGLEEAIRRMEAGEDPEAIEAEMGDVLDADPFAAAPEKRIARLRRKMLPPTVDTTLYEL